MAKDSSIRLFTRSELEELTTFQLVKICHEQKIVQGVIIDRLDRESLIRIILKYRSAEESLLIDSFKEGGFERVNEAIKTNLVNKLPDEGGIKIPAKITLYSEIGLKKEDMYRVEIQNDIDESNVLLVNENNGLCGIFNIVRDISKVGMYYLVAHKNIKIEKTNNRNYSFLFFKKYDSEYIYKTYHSDKLLPPMNLQYYRVPVVDLEIREIEDTDTVLAIDFGTSNTTAGAYLSSNYVSSHCYNDILNERIRLNEINIVKFIDVTSKDDKWIEVLPTIVYVGDCSDTSNIKYYFGYEAMNLMKKNDYTGNASVFQGIKRWVNSYSKIEEIYDEHGNIANVKRGDIIRAYIKHVIQIAEHQFKCRIKNVHISSPVKLKQQFLDMFQEIIPEYNVESKDALDEGIAVLYNTIADQIEKNRFIDGEEYKALIIDCGGGTTDLSSCSFRIQEDYISYKIDINTTYENGDTNFGGNNITYRIMQFMKILFANYYKDKGNIIEIDQLIDIPSEDIFRYVDDIGVVKIYEKFEEHYREAEKVIPTRFKEYENRVREDYKRVKNNFYFLWEIADNMKKEFFRKTSILRNKFDYSVMDMDEHNSDLHITMLNKWCLSVLENSEFKTVNEFPNIVFNIKEINKLIKGDIYDIVRKFLENFYQSRKLQDYSIIKLTGQSCRIDIFKEALKEFVPGKSIEFKQRKEDDDGIPDLKLSCLRGVLRYITSKKIGDIEPRIGNEIPVIPYSVSAYTFNKQEKVLLYSLEKMNQAKGFISRPIGVEEIEFFLKSHDGSIRQSYIFKNDFNEYRLVLPEDITQDFGNKIYQEDTDTIRNGEVRFFLYAHDMNWGFHVVPVARKDEQLYLGKRKFFAFEGELSELDFFDGLK
ncbi:MAG: molecular chaperone [Clostridiaceae bacterium]|nr:molecular chaperone [Clostridiaceae bacterium]